ncbi:MAG: type II toxin-antitoxin system VapC family toxin [Methanoregula sp.]
MNNEILFLDTCVFIDCLDSDKHEQILDHANNDGFTITTSITVLGETVTQLMECRTEIDRIVKFCELLDQWDVSFSFPNDVIRKLCYFIGEELSVRDDLFYQVTDRTHLAYAIAYKSDFFITSDRAIRQFVLPKKIMNAGYRKPDTLTLHEFYKEYLKKR